MSDLDDLARVATQRQQVSVRRPPNGPGVVFHQPPPPRSAFASGFYGTFGVIAALVVILISIVLYNVVTASIAAEALAQSRAAAASKLQEVQLLTAEAQREEAARADERIARYAAQVARHDAQQKMKDAALEKEFYVEQAELSKKRLADEQIGKEMARASVRINSQHLASEVELAIRNSGERPLQNVQVTCWQPDQSVPFAKFTIPRLDSGIAVTRGFPMVCDNAYFSQLKFQVEEAVFAAN
jgi:hypothetical protein